jgi:hypothetical protein
MNFVEGMNFVEDYKANRYKLNFRKLYEQYARMVKREAVK